LRAATVIHLYPGHEEHASPTGTKVLQYSSFVSKAQLMLQHLLASGC